MTIFIPDPIDTSGLDLLRENGAMLILPNNLVGHQPEDLLPLCDVAILATYYLDERLLKVARRLRRIVKHGMGVDNVVDISAAEKLNIQVLNTPGANSVSVAEHILLLMLSLSRHLPDALRAARSQACVESFNWIGQELAGKTLGILGLGNIGLELARRACLGMDMNIVGYDPIKKSTVEYIMWADTCEQVCSAADYLCLCLPLKLETFRLVNAQMLARMKSSAYLINTARGGIVDEVALYQALKNGIIAGAALDVVDNEHNWYTSPLHTLSNVQITPHIAAMTREACRRMSLTAAQLALIPFT